MVRNISLPRGRENETKSTGITQIGEKQEIPYKFFADSMKEVMHSKLKIEAEGDMPEEIYNPCNPQPLWGKMSILFASVKRHLPRRCEKERPQLFLYNAIGSSLDLLHGVDIFFLWSGVHVTIDLSLRLKPIRYSVDLTQDLEDMDEEAFDVFGKQVAELLKSRKEKIKRRKRRSVRIISNPG